MVAAYPALSVWAKGAFSQNADALAQWEKQSGASLVAVLGLRYMRRENIDQWIADAFMYTKSSILLLAYFMDYRVLAWYLVLYLVMHLYVVRRRVCHTRGRRRLSGVRETPLKRVDACAPPPTLSMNEGRVV